MSNPNRDVEISIRRTVVPIVAGYLLAQAARAGFSIPEAELVGVLEALVTGVYYTIVRLLEVRFPQVGILLGALSKPTYI